MVQLILTEPQLVRLKAAVATGSAESAALEAGKRFGGEVFSPEPIAVKCTLAIATRLLSVANRFCPEVVPKIRAAIEPEIRQQLHQEFTQLLRDELDKAAAATLAVSSEQTKHWVEDYSQALEAKRTEDSQAFYDALKAAVNRLESQRLADFVSLKRDVARHPRSSY